MDPILWFAVRSPPMNDDYNPLQAHTQTERDHEHCKLYGTVYNFCEYIILEIEPNRTTAIRKWVLK